jgi:hypothetical protein
VGAQPSDTVGRLLGASGMLGRHPRAYSDTDPDSAVKIGAKTDEMVVEVVGMPGNAAPLSSTAPTAARARGLADALIEVVSDCPHVLLHEQAMQ